MLTTFQSGRREFNSLNNVWRASLRSLEPQSVVALTERASHPGFRCGCTTHAIITGKEHPDRGDFGVEEYWPGMFICFEPGDGKEKRDSAYLRVRGDRRGRGMRGPTISETELGWWTPSTAMLPAGNWNAAVVM